MKLKDIYYLTKEQFTEIETQKAECILDIMHKLYAIEIESKLKYLPQETNEMKQELKEYLIKFYKYFKIGLLEEIENNKFLDFFPENIETEKSTYKINFEYLSQRIKEVYKIECKYIGG
jgi:hypothetical protein